MFHAFMFALKIGLLAAAAIWVAQRPGTIAIEWLGYSVKAHVGLVLLCLLAFVLAVLLLHRLALAVLSLPGRWRRRQKAQQQESGYRALVRGLSAVAAGDARQASLQAEKSRALWPEDKGLALLLEAQAARLRGEEDVARAAFDKLLKNRDTAFLGLRGLLVNALEAGDNARALALAQQALRMHPRQPWIVRLAYDLAVQGRQWVLAGDIARRAVRVKAIEEKKAAGDRVAILLARAAEAQESGRIAEAFRYLNAAHRLDRAFVPAAQRLAAFYIARKKKFMARPVLQATWKASPHVDLVPLWDALAPRKKNDGGAARLGWFETLVALRPDSPEGQLAAAQVAIEEELWGRARDYLARAEQIQPSARLYRLYAALEERLGRVDAANEMRARAADAPADKVWICAQTGLIYERWEPLARPHGSFNTIVWDYPKARSAAALLGTDALLPHNELMIVAR